MMDYLLFLIGVFVAVAMGGAAFTAGAAIVCRAMKWAPVNIIVNSYVREDEP